MLLLHLSDIHFREPDCLHADTDPERAYRTTLLREVREQVRRLGSVGAILVGGDIAFKGDTKEYEVALAWLRELAGACGCPFERIFVIPGNHDMDRRVVVRSPAVRNAQRAIADAPAHLRERELRTQFNDLDTGRSLLLPLAAYNDFAKFFSCQVYSPDHLYWKQDVPLSGEVHLRIYGLTSVLLSGRDGGDDNRESLYVSPLQTVLEPADDIVNLVLIHHPPDWLIDGDDVNDVMCGRAELHLLGHKHRQRITQEQEYVRYSAGAVSPDRDEAGWLPGYNLINLTVEGTGGERVLIIESHLMQWQTNPDRFRPMKTKQDAEVFRNVIRIPARTEDPARSVAELPPREDHDRTSRADDVEAAMSDEGTRNLVFRFWRLTMSQRREIALELGLIGEGEMKVPEPERYGRALLRAGERNLLENLAAAVARREKH